MHYQGALLLLIITHQLALMKKYRGQDGPHILIATPASATEKEKKKKKLSCTTGKFTRLDSLYISELGYRMIISLSILDVPKCLICIR